MRIFHFAQFGPRCCGLYGTVRDLIVAERRLGADAHLIDVQQDGSTRVGLRDGEIVTQHPDAGFDADILVRHTAIPPRLQNAGIPIVMAMHGRPESSWRQNASGDNDVIQAFVNKARDARYKKFICFWPEFLPVWRTIIPPEKLAYVPAPVDLEYYAGGKDLNLSGSPKILIADIWRDDVTPLDSIIAAVRFIEKYAPQGKVHLVGLPNGKALEALRPLLNGWAKYIGSASGQIGNIRDYYASCDVLVTPHAIATRIIRESLAAGLPVVASDACPYTDWKADPKDYDTVAEQIAHVTGLTDKCRTWAQSVAAKEFSLDAAGRAMVEVCRSVLPQPRAKRKLFLDIGAHLGETVHRFYRERPDAGEFDIYCFEPEPKCFAALTASVGHIPNVVCVNKALTAGTGARALAVGSVNAAEGSTLIAGKKTGGLDYKHPVNVACVDIAAWLETHPADETILKMNIEGAEYELLPRLAESGALARVNELYCQLHATKFPLDERMRMDQVEKRFREDLKGFPTVCYLAEKGMAAFAQPNPQ